MSFLKVDVLASFLLSQWRGWASSNGGAAKDATDPQWSQRRYPGKRVSEQHNQGHHLQPQILPLHKLGVVLQKGLQCIGRCVGPLPTFWFCFVLGLIWNTNFTVSHHQGCVKCVCKLMTAEFSSNVITFTSVLYTYDHSKAQEMTN